jgi:hypothetical protein
VVAVVLVLLFLCDSVAQEKEIHIGPQERHSLTLACSIVDRRLRIEWYFGFMIKRRCANPEPRIPSPGLTRIGLVQPELDLGTFL